MRLNRLWLLSICFLPTLSFAMACPGNGSIIDTHNTPEQITKICGQPTNQKTYQNTVATKLEMQFLVPNVYGTNNKVTLLFNNDQMINADVLSSGPCPGADPNNAGICQNETNTPSVSMCGVIIGARFTSAQVIAACGAPVKQTTLETHTDDVLEYQYDASKPNTLVFVNGVLSDWK